ncbi:MAG: nucleotide pyrophosphohydrolase [Phycisphaera sp.]|nr:nucleotide pyrophosphohydrolase [Phycisphaera sp.]
MSYSIKELQRHVLDFAEQRDWLQFHTPKNLSMAIAAEAAELMEHFLWTEGEASRRVCDEADPRAAVEAELADVLILALQMANVLEVDVPAAVERKLAANAAKYPVDRARGNARKYTDL